MNKAIVLAILFFGSFPLPDARLRQSTDENQSSCCKMIQEALQASGNIKMGMSRKEVEDYWLRDGGVQFREETRYMYPNCRYVRVDVKFDLVAPNEVKDSPGDRVKEVSKPYVAYPTMD
jgi:hypothetical protein